MIDNTQDPSVYASLDIAKLVEDASFQFEERIEMLNDIVDSEGQVVLASNNGKETKMNDVQSSAFRAGVATAISIIGKFPLSLDRPTNSLDIGELEA